MQVDVVIDENYVYDPTLYSMESFYMTYNITGGVAAANATFPFLRNAAVYRFASALFACFGPSPCRVPFLPVLRLPLLNPFAR